MYIFYLNQVFLIINEYVTAGMIEKLAVLERQYVDWGADFASFFIHAFSCIFNFNIHKPVFKIYTYKNPACYGFAFNAMLKVLLVDDEHFILQGLQVLINWENEGFVIAGTASDGNEALEFLRKNSVDLILADVNMPVIFLWHDLFSSSENSSSSISTASSISI